VSGAFSTNSASIRLTNSSIDETSVATTARFGRHEAVLAPWFRLTVVGGRVFTQDIEHTFEHRVNLVMQEVLL
jgi:hypothetical protein